MAKDEDSDDDMVCLDESFFINDDYQLATFTFGSHTLELFCLQSASTDFDLTGQIIWPGAMLMNDFLSKNVHILQGCSVIELGSGAGITGLLCSRFCSEILLTDHNAEVLKILKKNIQHHTSYEDNNGCADLAAEKLEWGDSHDINQIMQNHPKGFDLVIGADIYILFAIIFLNETFSVLYCSDLCLSFQQYSIKPLFQTVEKLIRARGGTHCKFILAYVSRSKTMDALVLNEAAVHNMSVHEIPETRSIVGNLEGVIYEITLQN
ncbi:unnamed protein product [Rhodiola kirilowii]